MIFYPVIENICLNSGNNWLDRFWKVLLFVVNNQQSIQLLELLASRLERLSVDSHWARRASGLRGNIIKLLEEASTGGIVTASRMRLLTDAAFEILLRAAQDISDLDIRFNK
jgi:hypothetical protein